MIFMYGAREAGSQYIKVKGWDLKGNLGFPLHFIKLKSLFILGLLVPNNQKNDNGINIV